MKIENDVAIRLAALKKKYRRPSYSDLLDSVCEFFEITNLSLTDINTSKKPASVLVQEGTSKIVSFIKQNEKLYDKKVLDLVEKIYLVIKDQQPDTALKKPDNITQNKDVIVENLPPKIVQENTTITDTLRKENTRLSNANSKLEYKLQHQRKFIEEFLSKFEINRMRKQATISENELEYYQNELRKLWL